MKGFKFNALFAVVFFVYRGLLVSDAAQQCSGFRGGNDLG